MIFLNELYSILQISVASQPEDTDRVILQFKQGTSVLFEFTSRTIGDYYEFVGAVEQIKAYMLQNNLPVFTVDAFYISVDAAGGQTNAMRRHLEVIFYTGMMRKPASLSADVFAANYFLTHCKTGWIAADNDYLLNFYASEIEDFSMVYTLRDGTTTTRTGSVSSGVGSLIVHYVPDTITVDVKMGIRCFTLYYVDMESVVLFKFRNVFNAIEYVTISASVNASPSTEFETAQMDNIIHRYDIENLLDIKIEAPAVPNFMYSTLLCLCRSHHVQFYDPYTHGGAVYQNYSDVIISEYKLDKSDKPNTPIALELTLQYCDTNRNSAIEFS